MSGPTVAACVGVLLAVLAVENLAGGLLNEMLLHLPGADKVLHQVQSLAVFSVAVLLLRRSALTVVGRSVIAALVAIAAAGLDEFIQQGFAERTIEAADITAGTCGALLGFAVSMRHVLPRVAAVIAVGALSLGSAVTYHSYSQTRDYNRGILADRRGDAENALHHYQRAVDGGTTNPEAFNALAWTILQTGIGDPENAVEYAAASLSMRPDDPDTLDTYGWALVRAGRTADAVRALERAYAAKPGIYCINYHLAMAYLGLGRREDGIRHLRRQVEQAPDTQEARLSIALLAGFQTGRLED